MNKFVEQTINDLAKYIQRIIKNGSSEERQLLPELINSLINLIHLFCFSLED